MQELPTISQGNELHGDDRDETVRHISADNIP